MPRRTQRTAVSNIFDDDPPGGLWDDELEPAHSATPRLRALRPVAEPPTSLSRHERPWANEGVIDLTERRSSHHSSRARWLERGSQARKACALLAAMLGLAVAVVAGVTAVNGTSEDRKPPPSRGVATPDIERVAATRNVEHRSSTTRVGAAARHRSTAHTRRRTVSHGGRSGSHGSASKPRSAQRTAPVSAQPSTTATNTPQRVTTTTASSSPNNKRCEFPPC